MSDFCVVTSLHGPPPEWLLRRVDALGAFLERPGSELSVSRFVVGSTVLVEVSTRREAATVDEWAARLRQVSHGEYAAGPDGAAIETPFVTGRTLWHRRDHDTDVVSTSMGAVAFLFGSVTPDDERAVAWMMTTGTLGPSASWDRDTQQLPPNSRWEPAAGRLQLREREGATWSMRSAGDWRDELDRRIRAVVTELDLDPTDWGLPLSGGVDSRGLALTLGGKFPMFTWGDSSTLDDPGSDLAVASRLASEFGFDHRVLQLSPGARSPDLVLDRFTTSSECRTDSIGGYVDGMQLWMDLRTAGVRGVVRGDEVFGWNRRRDVTATRISVGLTTGRDLRVPKDLRRHFEIAADALEVPAWTHLAADEALEDYRDRVYRRFRCAAALAALTQVKSGYVDVVNPFLADQIVELVMALPEQLRTDKRLFRELVSAQSRGIPFAQRASIPLVGDFLGSETAMECLRSGLADAPPSGIDAEFLGALCAAAPPPPAAEGRRFVQLARRFVPLKVRREIAIRNGARSVAVSAPALLFRAYLVGQGQQLVRDAARAGSQVTRS